MQRIEVESFAALEAEFIERVHSVVWCNVSSVDTQGRPRSRIMHPVWEGTTAWITSRRHSHKAKHLDETPYLSLAYVHDLAKPVYADCFAEWEDDPAEKMRVWELIATLPPPVGFDPATIFPSGLNDPSYGLLRLTPWRLELADFPTHARIWRPRG